jgi:hypothetical protein
MLEVTLEANEYDKNKLNPIIAIKIDFFIIRII